MQDAEVRKLAEQLTAYPTKRILLLTAFRDKVRREAREEEHDKWVNSINQMCNERLAELRAAASKELER